VSSLAAAADCLFGLCLSVQVVGSLLAPVDLWHDRRRSWPVIVRAVAGWCGLAALSAMRLSTFREFARIARR
jgi:hypothetical protein